MILYIVLVYDHELIICLYIQDFLHPHTSGEGDVGISDARGESSHEHMTPPASHVPLLSTGKYETCSMTPLRPDVSAPSSGRCTPYGTEEGLDPDISNNNA